MTPEFLKLAAEIKDRYTVIHAWLLYGLVMTLRPALIVETGTCNGYITAFLAQGLIDCGGEGTLYTIDYYDETPPHAGADDFERNVTMLRKITPLKNMHILKGEAIKTLTALAYSGKLANLSIAVLDDNHSRAHVAKEIDILYPHLVGLGCICGHDVYSLDLIGVNEAFQSAIQKYGLQAIWSHHSMGYIVCQRPTGHTPPFPPPMASQPLASAQGL
jgi:cephalosporin hydroxylase